jgi:hypothetical protein
MTVLDDLKTIEQRLTARLAELRPALEEYRELEAAARRLGLDVEAAAKTPGRPARRRAARTGKAAPARAKAASSSR